MPTSNRLPHRRRQAPARLALLSVALAAAQAAGAAQSLQPLPPASREARPVPAKTTPWARRTFTYRADSKRLADVLQDFAASQGLPAVVATDLDGVVNGNFDVRADVFLENMARAYNFIWYDDGTALYFYPGRAIQSRMFRLKGFSRLQLTSLMQALDVGDKRYPIRFDEANSTLYVSGPPRHVELVSSAIDTLDAGVADNATRTLQVFPLKYASAGDRQVGGQNVAGVASTLRKLFVRAPANNSADTIGMLPDLAGEMADAEAFTRRNGLSPLSKLATNAPKTSTPASASAPPPRPRPAKAQANDRDDPPLIEADEGTNAVVIQGRADRMADYGTLIARLDQKPMQVELVATIIEVSSDSVDSLGINWSLSAGKSSVSVTTPAGPDVPGVFGLGTVISNAGRELLARVNALQGEGKARVLSKPSVLGVVNRTAVMREKRVATVRVSGSRDANLFQIEAGTLLEMTPQISASGEDGNRIKLSIYIEDGNFESAQVDQVPIIKKTEIRTEAYVREGESLLIAGITVESDYSQKNAVPGLSRAPVVGGLFRSTDSHTQRTERLFLITPRVHGSADLAAPAVPQ